MDWEEKLLAMPTGQWVVDQVVVFDWHDGPRAGLCALAKPPAEFVFEFVDEELDPDGLDLRILRLRELPAGAVNSFAAALERLGLGPLKKPIWSPVWAFSNQDAQNRAEEMIEALERLARRTDLVISTTDMMHVRNCWSAKAAVETSR